MNKLIGIFLLLGAHSIASGELYNCDGVYVFQSPTSGKTITCRSASQCAKKHARASSYWQRTGTGKEKVIVTLRSVIRAIEHSVEYKSSTKYYTNGALTDKWNDSNTVFLNCRN